MPASPAAFFSLADHPGSSQQQRCCQWCSPLPEQQLMVVYPLSKERRRTGNIRLRWSCRTTTAVRELRTMSFVITKGCQNGHARWGVCCKEKHQEGFAMSTTEKTVFITYRKTNKVSKLHHEGHNEGDCSYIRAKWKVSYHIAGALR